MAGSWHREARKLLLILAILYPWPLEAQDSEEDDVVGQTLTWEGSDVALNYEIFVQGSDGREVFHGKVEVPRVELRLKPGQYQYKIVVYNLLEQQETDSGWQPMLVLRAEIPRPRQMEPKTLYLEDPVFHFQVSGVLLKEGAIYKLVRRDRPDIVAIGHVVARSGESDVSLEFPDFEFSYGDFDLTVENPGGLKHTLKDALLVRYEKPVDFHLELGYSASVAVYDAWYRSNWGRQPSLLGAFGRFETMFIKHTEDQWGIGIDAEVWQHTGGVSNAAIDSRFASAGLSVVYNFLFSKQWKGVLRAGGGMTAGWFTFDYGSIEGASWTSLDPYAAVGLGASYWFTKNWYCESDLDLVTGFNNGYISGSLKPRIAAGWSF